LTGLSSTVGITTINPLAQQKNSVLNSKILNSEGNSMPNLEGLSLRDIPKSSNNVSGTANPNVCFLK
jgi:hypothetical protein